MYLRIILFPILQIDFRHCSENHPYFSLAVSNPLLLSFLKVLNPISIQAHGEIPKDEDGIEESEIQGEADANNFAEGSENENFVWEDEVDEESDEESTVPQPKRRKTKQNKFPEQNIDEKKKKKKQKTSVVSNEGDYEQEGSDNNLDWMFE